jgi:hypothetical protein
LPALIADAIGLEQHPWSSPTPDGYAIAEFEPPVRQADPRWKPAFVDDWGLDPEIAGPITGTPLRLVTDGRLKLLQRGDAEELYDLETDPLEVEPRDPLTGDPQAVGLLREALATAPERPLEPASAAPVAAEISDEERQALEDRMKLLGYL